MPIFKKIRVIGAGVFAMILFLKAHRLLPWAIESWVACHQTPDGRDAFGGQLFESKLAGT